MNQSKKGTQPTMNKILQLTLSLAALAVSAQAQTITFGSDANQFQMEFVTIGNPGNVADTTGSPNPAGRVDYVYNIGKYEVSRDMINKANAAGSLGITLEDMQYYGGNGANRPATGISWNEAARFVNYLNTSQGYQAAYNFTTPGANANITLWGAGQYSGSNRFRHKDAIYVLPSMDEWYKAAYGSPSGTWYNYANGSDSAPSAVASGTSGAVYNGQSGPADITNAGGLSEWGTMAQNGNVWEWNESAFDGSNDDPSVSRVSRGGSWADISSELDASSRISLVPPFELIYFGFRVASVPEPSSGLLVLLGLSAVLRRRRKRSGLAV
jgi:formylglycine-generating enzyme required for sulfatase activity